MPKYYFLRDHIAALLLTMLSYLYIGSPTTLLSSTQLSSSETYAFTQLLKQKSSLHNQKIAQLHNVQFIDKNLSFLGKLKGQQQLYTPFQQPPIIVIPYMIDAHSLIKNIIVDP